MKFLRRLFRFVFVLAVIAAIIIGATIYWEIFLWRSNVAADVAIPKGSSLVAVANVLHKEGVIRSPKIFTLYARFRGDAGKLSAGEYEFPAEMTISEVLNKVVSGDVKKYQITVIEGWTIEDIANALAQKEFVGPEIAGEFRDLAHDPAFLKSIGFGGIPSLEGYLFPDTYTILKPKGAEELIVMMVDQFKEVYTDDFKLRAKELGMTDREVITLASIIEKETGKAEERPTISSVFHNRLKKGMVLATDPTVIYGIPNFDGNLRRSDLERPGPYNTYLNAGLPPGPIASPGLASIKAALYPAKTGYYFFVSKNDGSHYFSKTMGEHSRAVHHFQVRRSDEPFKK